MVHTSGSPVFEHAVRVKADLEILTITLPFLRTFEVQ